MKRCPECRRDYYDDTLLYCLDDGNALLEGPANRSEPPPSAGGEFSEEPRTAILNGRVMQRGDDLTLNLSLVDTRTGNQLWGEQYNRKQADLLSLQNHIAGMLLVN